PQRTSPPWACKSRGVTRKAVPQPGQRVISAMVRMNALLKLNSFFRSCKQNPAFQIASDTHAESIPIGFHHLFSLLFKYARERNAPTLTDRAIENGHQYD